MNEKMTTPPPSPQEVERLLDKYRVGRCVEVATLDDAHIAHDAMLLSARVRQLEESIAGHYHRDHLAGDGPEIDKWKARVRELEAYEKLAKQCGQWEASNACAEAEKAREKAEAATE